MTVTGTAVALVTGGSRGIGRAIGARLARDGYEVILTARDRIELDAACAEIIADGGRARPLEMDLARPASIAAALEGVEVDVLVNNAGVGIMKPMLDLTPEEWHRMVDVNVNALYHVTRALLPGMIVRGRGHVCTIGSIAGRSAFAGGSAYTGTKAFVTQWAESLMLEVRDQGVKVSVVMPGAVATEFGGKSPSAADGWKLMASDVADTVAHVLATPRHVLIHRVEVRTLATPPKSPS
jgi:NADP-dependent 3-hydroxy acid dehydrogenase YdfG